MLGPFLAVTLSAAAPMTVASVGFTGLGGEEDKAQFFAQHVAQQLSLGEGLKVVTPEDAAAVLGLERQKQLFGCWEEAQACLVELTGALKAQAILSGSVARVGARLSASVKVIDARTARALFATSVEDEDEEALLLELGDAARRARLALGFTAAEASVRRPGPPKAPVAEVRAVPASPRWKPFALTSAALVSFGVGTFFFVQAARAQRLMDDIERDPELPGNAGLVALARRTADQGKTSLTLGWTLAGVGAALFAGGLLWLVLDQPAGPAAAMVPIPGGFAAAVAASFP
jgi:TolB-like protein